MTPRALPLIPDGIPGELESEDRWVCWRWETRGGKWTKVPTNAASGCRASSTDPSNWAAFEEAVRYAGKNLLPGYGFRHDDTGEGYMVHEEEMRMVRRIFRAIAGGDSLHGVKRMLKAEGVPPPGNSRKGRGHSYWRAPYIREVIKEDAYYPHTREEVAALVSPEVVARLRQDEGATYGVFWFNRTRTTRKRVSTSGPEGRDYRWRYTVKKNPRDQWIAIPIPDAGIPRDVADAARQMARHNRSRKPKTGRRFFELSGGIFRCGGCGCAMQYYASLVNGKLYSYYKCARIVRDGKGACPVGQTGRLNHRAEEVEERVWKHVSDRMKDPVALREDLERMVELEQRDMGGDPDREARAWLGKLAEADRMRSGYQDLAAKGLMTFDELGEKLKTLDDTRAQARRELGALKDRSERVARLKLDKEVLLESHEAVTPEALDSLSPEDRNTFYKLLRLEVLAHPDRSIEVSQGALGVGFVEDEFMEKELVSRYLP